VQTYNDSLKHEYSDNIHNKKIAIFGITPPPLGGVSVHIQRVTEKFKKQGNEVYNFRTEFRGRRFLLSLYLKKVERFLREKQVDIVYYHSSYLPNSIREMLFLLELKKILKYKFVIVEHNCRHMYLRSHQSIEKFNDSIKKIDHIVFIGTSPFDMYAKNGLFHFKDYSVESAFLPPDVSQEKKIVEQYPTALFKFIKSHKPLLIANSSWLSLSHGKDIYGFDKITKMVSKLKNKYPNVGIIFVISTIGDEKYFTKLKRDIRRLRNNDNIYFLLGNNELWPLLKHADIFLRPTLVDGTSISIREALMFGTTVVASNACDRPKKVIEFDLDIEDDFFIKVSKALSQKELADGKNIIERHSDRHSKQIR